MTHTGITTRAGRCAICKKEFPVGTLVYFDATKSQGSHLAHVQCFDKLRASRPRTPFGKKGKKKVEVKSSEPLDPPF